MKNILVWLCIAGILICSLFLIPTIHSSFVDLVNNEVNNPNISSFIANILDLFPILGIGVFLIIGLLIFFIRYWIPYISFNNEPFRLITELQPFLLILFVFIVYIFKNFFLACSIVHSDFLILSLAIVLHVVVTFWIYKKEWTTKQIIISVLFSYVIFAFAMWLSSIVYDYSWDGRAYHQPAVIQLRDGWNPFHTTLFQDNSIWMWVNHYPKFAEMYGSFFGAIFGSLEAGKSYNVIFLIILFFYTLKIVSQYQKSGITILLITLMLVANPVVLAQIFTYYNDGLLGMLILLLVFTLMDFEREQKYRYLILALALSVFAINTKMSGLICGFVLIAYFIRYLIKKKYKTALIIMTLGILVLIIGILFTGYNPYIRNYLLNGHPLYPLFGENVIDIISGQVPLKDKNPIQRFFSLFFLEYDNWKNLPFNPLKLLTSIKVCGHADLRIGGFGLFLFEIWLLTLLLGFVSICRKRLKYQMTMLFPIFVLLFISLIMKENWWARYIPFFWYIPFLFLIPIQLEKQKILTAFLCVLIVINSGMFFSLNLLRGVQLTKYINEMVLDIKNSPTNDFTIVLDELYFSYATEEKIKQNRIKKNIIFIREEFQGTYSPFFIKKWYPN